MKEANSTSRLLRGFVVGAVLLGAAVSASAQTPPAAPAPAAPAAPAAEAPAAPPAAAPAAPAATDPAAAPAAPAAGAPAAAPAAPAIDPATGLPVAAPAAPAAPAAAPAIDPATGLPVAPAPAAAAPAPAAPPAPPPAPEKPKEPEGKMLDFFGLPVYVQDEYSLWGLFLIAHPIVKFVMMGLALCSIITWAIMFSKLSYFRSLNRRTTKFLDDFRASESRLQDLAKGVDASDASIPMAQMLSAAANEIELTMKGGEIASGEKREHLTQRIGAAMQVAQSSNQAELGSGMMFLATVGSIATFVGLFGTVWGIMYSFIGIAKTKTTNLSVVAPGIAEALFATAIGLFAAIPAVVIYNIFARKVGAYNQRLDNFSAELLVRVSRQLDQGAK